MEDNKIIKIENLKKSYGTKEVLKGVSLEVNQGEVFGLLGKNGAGKSTLIDCMIGLKKFNEGNISIFDMDIKTSGINIKEKFGSINL